MAPPATDSPLLNERLVPLKATSEYGCSAHPKTAWKWAKHGTRSRVNGEIHKLETLFQGSMLYTSAPAYRRFLIAMNAKPSPRVRQRRRVGRR